MAKGASVGDQNLKDGSNQLRRHQLRRCLAENMSEELNDIDDTEILRYLHNEKEIQIKALAWKIVNDNFSKGRRPNPLRNHKKSTPAEKALKIAGEKGNKKRVSSKINYDVLKKLMDDEHEEIPRTTDTSIGLSYDGFDGETATQ